MIDTKEYTYISVTIHVRGKIKETNEKMVFIIDCTCCIIFKCV